jgi:hypothetical protein
VLQQVAADHYGIGAGQTRRLNQFKNYVWSHPIADEILRALRDRPEGMTRTELARHFASHQNSEQIGRALGVLERGNFVARESTPTGGRPAQRWRAKP